MFSTTLSATFLILRRTERDMIKMCGGLYVKYRYYGPIWIKFEFSQDILEKITRMSYLMKIRPAGAELLHVGRWTDRRT
jgi:hypothetical protein